MVKNKKTIAQRASDFMEDEGIEKLMEDAREDGAVGFRARELLMQYALGKPAQQKTENEKIVTDLVIDLVPPRL